MLNLRYFLEDRERVKTERRWWTTENISELKINSRTSSRVKTAYCCCLMPINIISRKSQTSDQLFAETVHVRSAADVLGHGCTDDYGFITTTTTTLR